MSKEEAQDEDSKVFVDLARRTLYITGAVGDELAHKSIMVLELLDQQEGEIRIVLNSEGGEEQDGYAIYDAITMCKNKVVIEGYGKVLSIAAAIFQAGDVRLMAPHTDFMMHNGSVDGEPGMKQDAVVELADQVKKDTQKYYDILCAASQQPYDTIAEWCREEKYFTANEAVEAGFADAVIPPIKNRIPKKKRKRSKKS